MKALIFRRPELADAPWLFALDNDPDVMRCINGGTPISQAVFEAQILRAYLDGNQQHPFGFWIVEQNDTWLGWVSLRKAGARGAAEIGCRLVKSSWGKGYATQAVNWVLQRATDSGVVEKLIATTYEENLGSQRVLEKVGFSLVRRYRMTEEELEAKDTSLSGVDLWEGDDLLYVFNLDQVLATN
jgi:RimJ/RimL family protein N-acetyltransferase